MNSLDKALTVFYKFLILTACIPSVLFGQRIDDAKKCIESEDCRAAIKITSEMIASNNRDPEAYFYRGLAYYKSAQEEGIPSDVKQNFITKAREDFNIGVSKKKNYPFNYVGLGLTDVASDRIPEAKMNFSKALEMDASDVYLFIEMANAYLEIFQKKNISKDEKASALKEATNLLTRAESMVNPKRPEVAADVATALGDVWRIQGVEELAMDKYKKAIELNPKSLLAQYTLAKMYNKQKKLNEAKDAFVKVIEIDPKFAPAYRDLAELLIKAEQYDKSKYYAKKYVEILGNDVYGRVRYAQLLYLTKNYEEAITELRTAQKDTNSFVVTRLLAYSLAETKNWTEAQTQIDKFFAEVKQSDIIYKDYKYAARILANQSQFDKAEVYLNKAAILDSLDMVDLYKEFYNAYKAKEDWKNAVKYLSIYINKKPNVQDQFNLGWTYYVKLKDYVMTDSILKQVAAKQPAVIEAHIYLARANSKMDSLTTEGRAKPHYENLLKQVKEQNKADKYQKEINEAYNYLGYYYYNVAKDNNKALWYYLEVLKADPQNKAAKQMEPYLKGQGAKAPDQEPSDQK